MQALDCVVGIASQVAIATFDFFGKRAGGGTTSSLPTNLTGGPDCSTDPRVCPPESPLTGQTTTPLAAPAFG
ncbi:MAG: hypothetical protein MUD00_03400, partial [Candidatus Pacebacteria bacterium]|nr:hypothetical protein [Candidatus Paceibacterota bacterium]